MNSNPIVAIDGPAGSGKSTVAKALAKRLGFTHIDTGALYRGVALLALDSKVRLDSESEVVKSAAGVDFCFKLVGDKNLLHLNGLPAGDRLREEAIGQAASIVSAYPGVRALLLDLQRTLGSEGAVVLEGRDIGTVVFPKAEIKIFLTASIEARALRRKEELEAKGQKVDFEQLKAEMAKRDLQDSQRKVAPLRQASDAILVDTSGLTIESVLDRLESIVRNGKGDGKNLGGSNR